MAVDAGDDRADRRQVDVVVGVDFGHVAGREGVLAMRAGGECRLDDRVRVFGQGAGDTGAARARPLLAGVGQIWLLALRRR
jgi:hypothetical protein